MHLPLKTRLIRVFFNFPHAISHFPYTDFSVVALRNISGDFCNRRGRRFHVAGDYLMPPEYSMANWPLNLHPPQKTLLSAMFDSFAVRVGCANPISMKTTYRTGSPVLRRFAFFGSRGGVAGGRNVGRRVAELCGAINP